MAGAKEIRAGKAYIELTSVNNIQKGLNAAKNQLQDFGKSVSAIGAKIAGIGSAVLGLGGAAVKSFTETGSNLDIMSKKTGLTGEELSELQYVCEQTGLELDVVADAVKDMNERFAEASILASGEMVEGLEMIGKSVKDLEGMSAGERFQFLSDEISKIEDPAKKTAVAIKLLGEAGYQLSPVLGNIKELRAEAKALGLAITDSDIKKASELAKVWKSLSSILKMAIFEIGSALAPAVKELSEQIKVVATAVLRWIKENKDVVVSIAKVAAIVAGVGTAILAVGGIITAVGAVFGALSTIIAAFGTVCSVVGALITGIGSALAFLISPVGLVLAAVVGLAGAVLYYTGAMGDAVNWLTGTWGKLKDYMAETWQGVKDAFEGGDLKLAVKILWLSVKATWLAGIMPLRETWIGLKSMLADGWADIFWGMTDAFSACVYGIKEGWSATVYWLLDTINAGVNGLIVAWNSVTSFLTEAWAACMGGLTKTFNNVMGGLAKAWVRLKGLFSDKIDVEAEIKRIDNETAQKNNATDDETAEIVKQNQERAERQRQQREREKAATDEARRQEKEQNQREREADKAAIKTARDAEKQANQDYYADEMKGAHDALEQARKERQAALDEAKRKAEEARAKKKSERDDQKNKVETAIAETKGSAKGSFYADQIAGVKASSDAKRTADGVAQLVKETKDTNKILKKNAGSTAQTVLAFS